MPIFWLATFSFIIMNNHNNKVWQNRIRDWMISIFLSLMTLIVYSSLWIHISWKHIMHVKKKAPLKTLKRAVYSRVWVRYRADSLWLIVCYVTSIGTDWLGECQRCCGRGKSSLNQYDGGPQLCSRFTFNYAAARACTHTHAHTHQSNR